jgi:predicted Zn-dependent protease
LLDSSPTPARSREAEDLLRQALARDPSNIYARYKLGRLALDRGDAKGAVSALTVVVAHSPDIAEAWYNLGMAQERLGDAAQAARALAESRRLQQAFQERTGVQEQIALHPRDPALRLRMARLYAKNGENAKALYEYQAGLHLAPTRRAARAELAALEARLKAEGRLPSMSLYAAMVAQMTKSAS